ncbi:hypothetical protein LTR28_003347 [Elasticomyces elasticus]|nr:hypothetical protein LTR28_003347 [Elasticomyces elasticus]
MTRASQTVTILVLISSIYAAAFLGLLPLSDKVREEIVPLVRTIFRAQSPFSNPSDIAVILSAIFGQLSCYQTYTNTCPSHATVSRPTFALRSTTPLSSHRRTIPLTRQQQIPFTSLVAFGSYLLAKLGYGVLTFNDVPEAHKELMMQIETARAELRAKGVEVE